MIYELFFMLGGVVAMMFGMKIMGSSLERFAGPKMKSLLGKLTTNRFAGVGVGIGVTGIIQSSTATTVMLVGFVNIGLLTLAQATNVIMGANIGTTVTALIVSASGVEGAIDVGAIVAFVGFIAIMISMLIRGDKIENVCNIFAGLGLIFVGLEFISIFAKELLFEDSGMPISLVQNIFLAENIFPLLLILVGIVLTAIVHSSSTITSLMVVLAGGSVGVLSFENAIFLALGSNIGTCVTSIMSSVGACANAKRTAVVHLLFNVLGCLIVLAPIWIWKNNVVTFFQGISNDVGFQIAIFHTFFNLITTALLLPFSNLIVKIAKIIVPDGKQDEEEMKLAFLDNRLLENPTVAVGNIRKEIVRMTEYASNNLNLSMEMLFDEKIDNSQVIVKNEKMLNFLNHAITDYMTKAIGKDLIFEDDKKISSYFHVVSDVERIGDLSENIMEYAQRLRKEELKLSASAIAELKDMLKDVNNLFDTSVQAFDKRDIEKLETVNNLEEQVDKTTDKLENKHIARVKAGRCAAQVGSVYLQTVSNLERIGDHITNVAFSIHQYTKK